MTAFEAQIEGFGSLRSVESICHGVRSKIPVAIIGSGNFGTDLIKIMRTNKTLELTSPVWSWVLRDEGRLLAADWSKPSVRDEGD